MCPTPTDTTTACCDRIDGAPRRTPRPTSSPTSGRAWPLLDVGCGPGTITRDLARRVAPGRVVGIDASGRGRSRRPGPWRPTGTSRRSPSRSVTCSTSASTTTASTWSTPTRCSSTWVTRWRRWPRCAGSAVREASSPSGTVTIRACGTFPTIRSWTRALGAYGAVTRVNGANWDAGRRLLSWANRSGFTAVAPFGIHLVLRHPRGPGLVGGPVGRPVHRIRARRPVGDLRHRLGGGPGVVRRRLAALGRVTRRLVRRASRGGDLHGVTVSRRASASAARKRSGASIIG